MKIILFLLFFIHCSSSWALGHRHMVTVSTHGFGWSGAIEQMDSLSGSNFKRVEHYYQNIGMNYAYLINERVQIGGFFQITQDEYKFFRHGENSSSDEVETNTIGIFTLYNFSEEISDSYYLGLAASVFNYEEENSQALTETEGKAPYELDDQGETYELVFGKRFGLRRWKIEHLTFSPQINFYYRTHAKDFNDQRIDDGLGVKLMPIKFDFLF